MLGFGIGISHCGIVGGVSDAPDFAASAAKALLAGETQGLAFDFTDQSAYILDTGTPANNYDSTGIVSNGSLVGPSGKLIYTLPSNKLTLQADGVMRYQAHNLFVRSGDFSSASWGVSGTTKDAGTDTLTLTLNAGTSAKYISQTVTLVAGAQYTVEYEIKAGTHSYVQFVNDGSANSFANFDVSTGVIGTYGSGVVSAPTITAMGDGWYLCRVTWSGANTYGTSQRLYGVTSASATYAQTTASTGTFLVRKPHLFRYPANTEYVITEADAVYALPLEYDTSGNCLGLLVEEQRTNLCLYSNDLTQAGSWTASNMTTAKTATGPDNVANSATTITATAGNATILQAITSTSAARVTSVYIKRRTGTGNIDLTQDNGSTWTTQAVTSTWTRFSLSSVTSANPTVGIRIVTSGDAVDVALFSHEVGSFPTSPILTYGAAATRLADNVTIAYTAFPFGSATGTFYVQASTSSIGTSGSPFFVTTGSNGRFLYLTSGNDLRFYDGTNAHIYEPNAVSNTTYSLASGYGSSTVSLSNGGTLSVTDGAFSGTMTAATVGIGSDGGGGNNGTFLIKKLMFLPRKMSNAELQTVTT